MDQVSNAPIIAVEVATLALRNLYPTGLRKWGMLITVYADPSSVNNRTYQLVYNQASTTKSDNSNWSTTNLPGARPANTKKVEFPLPAFNAVTAGSATIIAATDIANGESVNILCQWTGKDDVANTGCGGLFSSTWTKQGGVLVKVADNDVIKQNNLGWAVTVSTSQSSGAISIDFALTAPTNNFSYTGYVTLLYRKAT